MSNASAPGRPPDEPGKPRTGLIRARVLPETEDILKKAAGGSDKLPKFLDEIAKIIANLGA